MTSTAPKLAQFHAMTDGTTEDWRIIGEASMHNFVGLPERLMAHLELLSGDFGGFAVDRLTHSLQTATRAERAGRDDEFDYCAEFCAEYDQNSFDPDYPTEPLEHFEPLIRSVLAAPKRSVYNY